MYIEELEIEIKCKNKRDILRKIYKEIRIIERERERVRQRARERERQRARGRCGREGAERLRDK